MNAAPFTELIELRANVPTLTTEVRASLRIPYPFIVREIILITTFPNAAVGTLRIGTSAAGTEVLAQDLTFRDFMSARSSKEQSTYQVNAMYQIHPNLVFPQRGLRIKFELNNTDAAGHFVHLITCIEKMPETTDQEYSPTYE